MLNRFLVTLAAAGVLLAAVPTFAQGQGGGPGTGAGELTEAEEATLVFMREEEKMARDAYLAFLGWWGDPIFANIADSEQRHMDAVKNMLDHYGVEDPVVDDTPGVFVNSSLQSEYDRLTLQGSQSRLEAFQAGGFIEEVDIGDLQNAIAATDKDPLINVYSNLLAGSMNHLRAFVSHIVALGVDYTAQVLDPDELAGIIGDEVVPPPAEGFTINANMSDAWYYPGTDGQGFFIAVFPDQQKIMLAWFTFDTFLPDAETPAVLGDPGQRWLTAQGSYAGAQAELQVYSSSGGLFDSGEPAPVHEQVGSVLLQFDDCASGSVTYELPGIGSNVIPIERVALDNITHCERANQP